MNRITKSVILIAMLVIIGTLAGRYISNSISTSLIDTFAPF